MRTYILGFFTCTLLTSLALNFYLSGKQQIVCEIGYNAEQRAAMDALLREVEK